MSLHYAIIFICWVLAGKVHFPDAPVQAARCANDDGLRSWHDIVHGLAEGPLAPVTNSPQKRQDTQVEGGEGGEKRGKGMTGGK